METEASSSYLLWVALGVAAPICVAARAARGYDVGVATTGKDAIAPASRHPPDVVALDLGLPGISGIDVIRGLRGWTSVPNLILSARDDRGNKVAALDAGADDYVTKPFDMKELLAQLRAALRRGAAPQDEAPLIETDDFTVWRSE